MTSVQMVARNPISIDVTLACGCTRSEEIRTNLEAASKLVDASLRACDKHSYIVVRQEVYIREGRKPITTIDYKARGENLSKKAALDRARALHADNHRRSELRLGKMYVVGEQTKAGGNVTITNRLPTYTMIISYTVLAEHQLPHFMKRNKG
jgi:hypothetical protein